MEEMRTNSKSIFNNEEKEFILKNYVEFGAEEIAKILNKTKKQVKGYADGKGIKRGNKSENFSGYQTNYIKKWYNIKTNKEIADALGLKAKQVNDYGYRHVGKMTHYLIDDTYFEVIDTEEKAYWLGFLYADGCINDYKTKASSTFKSLELALCKKDERHVEKFRDALGSTHKIFQRFSNGFENCKITIGNTKLCNDLIEKGCVPRKSLVLKFPTSDIISKELENHFIRGYFDGDGCVSISSETSKSKHYSAGLVGTKDMINSIQDILYKECGLNKIKHQTCGSAWQVMWGGKGNFKKWYDYLYKDATIWLDRKYEKFNSVLNENIIEEAS